MWDSKTSSGILALDVVRRHMVVVTQVKPFVKVPHEHADLFQQRGDHMSSDPGGMHMAQIGIGANE